MPASLTGRARTTVPAAVHKTYCGLAWTGSTFRWLVPEPGTLSLFGLASVAFLRRRR
ncbi:MAG: PEP-CTERM sorting domain-containing protein [bacterium]|nr:PEP-CTERM sorting domain-containing protein [bacterium]